MKYVLTMLVLSVLSFSPLAIAKLSDGDCQFPNQSHFNGSGNGWE
jgi:hypothetical protein